MKYFVFSSFINAYTLKVALSQLGGDLRTTVKNSILIESAVEPIKKGDTLFFTEENSLKKYFYQQDYYFSPKEIFYEIIDDKYVFACFLSRIGESPIKYSDIFHPLNEYPVYLKARHSWFNDEKLPRGYICKNSFEIDYYKTFIQNKGWDQNLFFYQRLLKSSSENNISVSGYFNYENQNQNLFIITKKISVNNKKISTASIVCTIKDPNQLITRTKNILRKIYYKGPFELEFFLEEKDNVYYVLELNPRFWMQHGIFLSFFNNLLVKRYLQIDSDQSKELVIETNDIVWVNTISLIESLLKMELNFLTKIIAFWRQRKKICYYPNLYKSITYILFKIKRKIKNFFSSLVVSFFIKYQLFIF